MLGGRSNPCQYSKIILRLVDITEAPFISTDAVNTCCAFSLASTPTASIASLNLFVMATMGGSGIADCINTGSRQGITALNFPDFTESLPLSSCVSEKFSSHFDKASMSNRLWG